MIHCGHASTILSGTAQKKVWNWVGNPAVLESTLGTGLKNPGPTNFGDWKFHHVFWMPITVTDFQLCIGLVRGPRSGTLLDLAISTYLNHLSDCQRSHRCKMVKGR